ncbi:hypothetical protein [Streptomyces lasiicapitis]|uniref:Integral membrane protein n=1 Tax=Streptomyces lasiicapitis TaxID=1923961 RepID=A0ABQ2M2V1_9ACTN|nr:hypothetical protein [Streptomyces lasiicapitis]GGO46213.1 hypothetical protein GCM10012286_36600 [Streptomyces lasiicapitis]
MDHFLLLVPLVLIGLIAVFGFVGYGCGTLGRIGLRQADRETWLRSCAALLCAAAAATYIWGLLGVTGAVVEAEDGGTDSAPIRSCRTPGWQEREATAGIIDYTVDYVPLRFVCETSDGGSYATDAAPGYVNPAALGFALAALGVGAAARWSRQHGPSDSA